MFRSFMFAVAVLPAAAWGQSAFTDARNSRASDAFALRACSDAAEQEVKARNPMAGSVDIVDSQASASSPTSSDISGSGQVSDGSHAKRSFSFRCSYDVRSGKTSGISVSL